MKEETHSEIIRQVLAEAKKYGRLRLYYLKLLTVEKISVLLSMMAFAGIVSVLAIVVLLYLAASLQAYWAVLYGSVLSYVMVAGIFVILAIVVAIFRKAWIINPITRFVSKLFIDGKYK